MNSILTCVLVALVLVVLLGLVVYKANNRRVVNQVFLWLSIISSLWLVSLGMAMTTQSSAIAAFWIRQASWVGVFIPISFNLLRLAVVRRRERWPKIVRRGRSWIALNLLMAIFCQTDFFLKRAIIPAFGDSASIPQPIYGPGFAIYLFYFIGSVIYLFVQLFKDARKSKGVQQNDLYFILGGVIVGKTVGILLVFLIPLFTGEWWSIKLAPISLIIIYGVIGWGIATHQILDVAAILRRGVAYAVLGVYVLVLYVVIWLPLKGFLKIMAVSWIEHAHLITTLLIAFSLVPTQGWLQQTIRRLFIGQTLDVAEVNRQAHKVFHSISTLSDLLKRFAQVLVGAVGTNRISIFLLEGNHFIQKHAFFDLPEVMFSREEPLVSNLQARKKPILTEALERRFPSSQVAYLAGWLNHQQAAIALGIFAHDRLVGIMLLGPKLSGKIYGEDEQEMLQILCNQLGIALHNASLYTEIQNSKIYNDILLDNLASGVIATNTDGFITICNREAQRLTNLRSAQVIGQPLKVLPTPIVEVLQQTLKTQLGISGKESLLACNGSGPLNVQISSGMFMRRPDKELGAFLVLNDVTNLKKLETQLRRNDRLASMGTLCAGMAHEIKNPLVAIKTFTQLLPERYQDPEFRESFSKQVGDGVERINFVVNQLLSFAKPVQPSFASVDLKMILERSLDLLQHQMEKTRIRLEKDFPENKVNIQADLRLLEQAFLNLFLNAIEAMEKGGLLRVSLARQNSAPARRGEVGESHSSGLAYVTIRDSGRGMPPEQIPLIFDPFFTTKSTGTGLGLAVAYQIFREHHAQIEVESELMKGTSFQIIFPVDAR